MVDATATCWTCDVLTQYSDLTSSFANNLSGALHGPMLILFTSLAGLWFVITGYKIQLQLADTSTLVKGFIFISITSVLFTSQVNGLISQVYSGAIAIMGSSADAAFKVAGGTLPSDQQYTGLVALAAAGEDAFTKVFKIAQAIASAGRLFDIANWVYAAFLVIPYFLLVAAYSSQVVVAIFRAMMVAVFSPFLAVAFAFDWGRGMAWSGLKTLLGAVLVLFASTAALALIIFAVNQIPIKPAELREDVLNDFASLTNPQFILTLALGWIGTGLMAEGVALANSIAGTALTNTAAGIMTAGASATGLALGKFGGRHGNPLTMGRRYTKGWEAMGKEIGGWAAMGSHAVGIGRATAGGVAGLVDKFKNINSPGGGS